MTGLEGKQTAPKARSHSASRISSEPSLAAGASEHFGDLCGLLLNGVPDPEVDIPRLMLDGVTFLEDGIEHSSKGIDAFDERFWVIGMCEHLIDRCQILSTAVRCLDESASHEGKILLQLDPTEVAAVDSRWKKDQLSDSGIEIDAIVVAHDRICVDDSQHDRGREVFHEAVYIEYE